MLDVLRWDEARRKRARESSWHHHGKRISFYLPGMYIVDGERGLYPALSLTGTNCSQHCAHCDGKLLLTMMDASSPEKLVQRCKECKVQGMQGVLLSGGCSGEGTLPWSRFVDSIARAKAETGLFISVHSGLLSREDAFALKRAGVDQALIDIIGSDETYERVYHLPRASEALVHSLDALSDADLLCVPHIVAGLDFGRFVGELSAVDLLRAYSPPLIVVVVLMNLAGTAMEKVMPPRVETVCGLLIHIREQHPRAQISLGCARPRQSSVLMEEAALLAGVNRMALPSHETIELARNMGLELEFYRTCCSVRSSSYVR